MSFTGNNARRSEDKELRNTVHVHVGCQHKRSASKIPDSFMSLILCEIDHTFLLTGLKTLPSSFIIIAMPSPL